MYSYKTHGTCSVQINFNVDSTNKITFVQFVGGCAGNTQGVAKLCIGRTVDDVISTLSGIQCRGGTSCPDQFARALKQFKEQKMNEN